MPKIKTMPKMKVLREQYDITDEDWGPIYDYYAERGLAIPTRHIELTLIYLKENNKLRD